MKRSLSVAMTFALCAGMVASLAACGSTTEETSAESTAASAGTVYNIGLCNYVDDASLNQICENIQEQLEAIGEENGVTFNVDYQNCNADSTVLGQIVDQFVTDDVDLMIGVATPVAMAMQAATEDTDIPVVFAAVSDPISTELVASMDEPGANITGTSDALDTSAIMSLITAADPDVQTVGLLYDLGQDSSTAAIASAKEYLDENNIAYKEYTGTNSQEVELAVQSLIADGVDAVFTPSDNTIMNCELSIYEELAEAGIPHYAGADSFALNGAFCGYGVDYANLGVSTADMAADILMNDADVSTYPVMTFDNGIATVNTDICDILGLDYDTIAETFAPLCTTVQPITTAESFED